jgi:hypothetical protein
MRRRLRLTSDRLFIMCMAHTRDNSDVGFTVEMRPYFTPFSPVSQMDYILAWRRLRRFVGLPTEREDYE